MDLYDDATTVQEEPPIPAAGPNGPGYFTDGTPGTQPATILRGWWLSGLALEIRAVIVGAGLTPARAVFTQLYQAIQTLVENALNAAPHGVVSLSGAGTWTVPANVYSVRVGRWGGGGGGGGASAGTVGQGGGAGAYAEDPLAVVPGQQFAYSVGTYGAAGTQTTNGGTGQSTTFGGLAAVNGGIGGNSSGSGNGKGAAAPVGAFSLPGGDGSPGLPSPILMGGRGGDAPMGGQGGVSSSAAGNFGSGGVNAPGSGVGAGGGGAGSTSSQGYGGAPGNAGGIKIWW